MNLATVLSQNRRKTAIARTDYSRPVRMAALRWLEPEHETGDIRRLGRRLRESGSPLFCVWTGRRLTREFDVDHCFPFAAWPCNDLWNLLPSAPDANRRKGGPIVRAGGPRTGETTHAGMVGPRLSAQCRSG